MGMQPILPFTLPIKKIKGDGNDNCRSVWTDLKSEASHNKCVIDKACLVLGIIRESVPKPQGIGYEWPTLYKVPGHVYYDLSFLLQQGEYICHYSQ